MKRRVDSLETSSTNPERQERIRQLREVLSSNPLSATASAKKADGDTQDNATAFASEGEYTRGKRRDLEDEGSTFADSLSPSRRPAPLSLTFSHSAESLPAGRIVRDTDGRNGDSRYDVDRSRSSLSLPYLNRPPAASSPFQSSLSAAEVGLEDSSFSPTVTSAARTRYQRPQEVSE